MTTKSRMSGAALSKCVDEIVQYVEQVAHAPAGEKVVANVPDNNSLANQ